MPILAVPNVIVHPSTVSVPITVLLYNGTLLCGFNVPIKGLNTLLKCQRRRTALNRRLQSQSRKFHAGLDKIKQQSLIIKFKFKNTSQNIG